MNGHANCILAVCCPPDSDGQRQALADEIAAAFGWSAEKSDESTGNAYAVAKWILKNYDLAPPGSLQAFKEAVRDLAREGYVKAEPQNGGA